MENTLSVYNTKENILTWLFWGQKKRFTSDRRTKAKLNKYPNNKIFFFLPNIEPKKKKYSSIEKTDYQNRFLQNASLSFEENPVFLSCSYLKVNLVFKEASKYLRTSLTVQWWLDICSSLEGVLQRASEDGFRKHFWKTSCRHVTRVPSTASRYSKLRRAVQH